NRRIHRDAYPPRDAKCNARATHDAGRPAPEPWKMTTRCDAGWARPMSSYRLNSVSLSIMAERIYPHPPMRSSLRPPAPGAIGHAAMDLPADDFSRIENIVGVKRMLQ